MTVITTKICRGCGTDVSSQKRVKNQRGEYFCEPCAASLRAGHVASAVGPTSGPTVSAVTPRPPPLTPSHPFIVPHLPAPQHATGQPNGSLIEAVDDKQQSRPLITTAAILSFVWAVLMTLVAMVQIAENVALLALWNLMIGALYVLIGVGLLRLRPEAYNWALWTNVINSVVFVIQIAAGGAALLGLLLILQIVIAMLLVLDRRAQRLLIAPAPPTPGGAPAPPVNPVVPTAQAQPVRLGQYPRLVRDWWVRTTGPGTGMRGHSIRVLTISGGIIFGFIGSIYGAILWSDLTHKPEVREEVSYNRGGSPDVGVPTIKVTGMGAEATTFSNWRVEQQRKLIGTMRYDALGVTFQGCSYTARQDGHVVSSGAVAVPGGWAGGESVEVTIFLPKPASPGLEVTIDVDALPVKASDLPSR